MNKLRNPSVIVLMAVVMPLLVTHAWAQSSTELGDNSIEVNNALGLVFEVKSLVPTSRLVLGESGGTDVDLLIKDPNFSVDENSLRFNSDFASLWLGSGTGTEVGDDGDLHVLDKDGITTISLNGDDGNATQDNSGNGFVKAWVRVLGTDGTIFTSYNVVSVTKLGGSSGVYFVTFNPTTLNDRPMSAVLDGHNSTPSSGGISIGLDDGFHPGTKQVFTYDASGTPANRSFSLVVY